MTAFDLDRFLVAQEGDWPDARAEIAAGRKTGHWIWYVWPQLAGLGRSARSEHFGLSGLAEAGAYLGHPVLGARLVEISGLLLGHTPTPARDILGQTDAAKVRSSATLFSRVPEAPDIFARLLGAFYGGRPDPRTLERI